MNRRAKKKEKTGKQYLLTQISEQGATKNRKHKIIQNAKNQRK